MKVGESVIHRDRLDVEMEILADLMTIANNETGVQTNTPKPSLVSLNWKR